MAETTTLDRISSICVSSIANLAFHWSSEHVKATDHPKTFLVLNMSIRSRH